MLGGIWNAWSGLRRRTAAFRPPVVVELRATVRIVDVPRSRDAVGRPKIVVRCDEPPLSGDRLYAYDLRAHLIVEDELGVLVPLALDLKDVRRARGTRFTEDGHVVLRIGGILDDAICVEATLVYLGGRARKPVRILMPARASVLPELVYERSGDDPPSGNRCRRVADLQSLRGRNR